MSRSQTPGHQASAPDGRETHPAAEPSDDSNNKSLRDARAVTAMDQSSG
ncbi:MAG TPA: hypothetical protein VGB17_06825 [Pyrinomonadaceae bacterium]